VIDSPSDAAHPNLAHRLGLTITDPKGERRAVDDGGHDELLIHRPQAMIFGEIRTTPISSASTIKLTSR